jgi:cell division protein FtsI (penicillin-binding protein 3)
VNDELKRIKNRIARISGLIFLVLLVYFVRLVYVSVLMGPELRAQSAERLIERKIIPAKRGDIYSADGKTLATTKPVYKVHFDAVTVDEDVFQAEVAGLGAKLATINTKYTAAGWTSYLKEQRRKRRRYVPLASKLNFSDLQRMRTYPILKLGAFQGGLIIEEDHERIQMATNMQMRTIGYDLEGASAGLEGYYSEYHDRHAHPRCGPAKPFEPIKKIQSRSRKCGRDGGRNRQNRCNGESRS